jgi:hypothetical protein
MVGNGPAGFELGTGTALALGDVQVYDGPVVGPWADVLAAATAPMAPPPPWSAPPSQFGAPRLAACIGAPPVHRYGAGTAYPVTGGIAKDTGAGPPILAELVFTTRAGAPLVGVLSFATARTLSLGSVDMSSWEGLTIMMMSDTPLCASAPVLEAAGYTVAVTGSSCTATDASVVVISPWGAAVTLKTPGGSFSTALPTASALAYVAVTLGPSGVTVYSGGRAWASSDQVWWDAGPSERTDIYGWGTLLDVQVYATELTPENILELSIGKSTSC